MTTQDGKGEPQEHRDFFISYTSNDLQWAKWIANQLNDAGYTYILDKRDFQPGSYFLIEMNNATKSCDRTLVVLSPDYLQSEFTTLEWIATLRKDPTGARRCLLPVRVKDFRVDGLLGSITYIDLVSCDEDEAKERLLAGVPLEPAKHEKKVPYPGPQSRPPVPFPGSLPAHWNIPYERNPFFIGRDDILLQLHDYWMGGQASKFSQPQAITGLGGIGKTQLALEYAYRYRVDYQAVLWVLADTRENLISSYLVLARLLSWPEQEEQESEQVIKAVKQWFQQSSGWLLILDNADDPALAREFLPRSFGGHVLLTTRGQPSGRFARCLDVGVFSTELGALFLLCRAGVLAPKSSLDQAKQVDQDIARAICEELGGLPLALDQAGAYIEEVPCSLSEYQALYHTKEATLLGRRGGLIDDHPEPVSTTWLLSFDKVEQQNAAAADLLRLCAYLAPYTIPKEIIIRGAEHLGPLVQSLRDDLLAFHDALAILRAYSLVRRESIEGMVVHRLVQRVLRKRMELKEEQYLWQRRAVLAVETTCPENVENVKHWVIYEQLLPHASEYAKMPAKEQIKSLGKKVALVAARLFFKMGNYSYKRAQYTEAELFYQRSLDIRELLLERNHLDIAYSKSGLGNTYSEIGKYNEAEKLYRECLDIFKQNETLDPCQFARLLNNLAIIFKVQNKYKEAEDFYRRSLRIWWQHRRTELLNYAQSLNNLAVLYGEQEYLSEHMPYKTATRYLKLSLKIQIQQSCDNYDAIAKLPLKKQVKRFVDNFDIIARTLNNLANLYIKQSGNTVDCSQLFKLGQEIQERQLGKQSDTSAQSLYDLASTHTEQGVAIVYPYQSLLYKQARELYQLSVGILVKNKGRNHPDVAYPLNGLAILFYKQGEYKKAEKVYKHSLSIWEQSLRPTHPQTAYSFNNLAMLYFVQGEHKEAKTLCQNASTIFNDRLRGGHPHTRVCDENLRKINKALE